MEKKLHSRDSALHILMHSHNLWLVEWPDQQRAVDCTPFPFHNTVFLGLNLPYIKAALIVNSSLVALYLTQG